MGDRPAAAVDELVSMVWKRMDGWGTAGEGMHWRPELRVVVPPEGEARFRELTYLLEESGIGIVRARP
jgi:hypothetical protein